MRVNFSEITIGDIDGNIAISSDIHKTIANLLFNYAKTVDFVEIAMDVNKGNSVDLSVKQIEEIRTLIKTPISGIIPVLNHARKAFDDFADEILATEAQRLKEGRIDKQPE